MTEKSKSPAEGLQFSDSVSAARHIREELAVLKSLSMEKRLSMLHYLLDMAYLETDRIIHPNADIIEDHALPLKGVSGHAGC